MPRKYLVTEDEYLSMRIESDGHLRMTRDNGDIVDAGLALGPAVTDADMAGFVADPTSATATQLSATYVSRGRLRAAKSAPPSSLLRLAAPVSPTVIAADSFAGTAGTTLSGRNTTSGTTTLAWSVASGTWQLDGAGEVGPTAATDGLIATLPAPANLLQTGYSVSVDVDIAGSGANWSMPALVFGYKDASNFWYLTAAASANLVRLYRVSSGTHTVQVAFNATFTAGTKMTFRVDVLKRDITVWIDGVEQYTFDAGASAASATVLNYATVGLRQGIAGSGAACKFGNFKVTEYARPVFNVPRLASQPAVQVLPNGAPGSWNETDNNNPNVVWDPVNERWVLYYSGYSSSKPSPQQGMGLAYSGTIDGTWVDDAGNPWVPAGGANIENGALAYVGGRWIRVEDNLTTPQFYTSSDLHTWSTLTVYGLSGRVSDPFFRITQTGLLEMWYGNGSGDIQKAISADYGVTWRTLGVGVAKPPRLGYRGNGEPSVYVPPGKEGTEMMVFADIYRIGGEVRGTISAGITVDGGATWSWHMIRTGSGSGFDSYQIFDPFPVWEDGVLYLFFSGGTSAGSGVNMDTSIGRLAVEWSQEPLGLPGLQPYQ